MAWTAGYGVRKVGWGYNVGLEFSPIYLRFFDLREVQTKQYRVICQNARRVATGEPMSRTSCAVNPAL